MMKLLLLWILGLSSVFGLPTTDDNELTENQEVLDCHGIFADNGMNYSTFHKGAGHGAHSLSLEEIRYFFDKDATEENNIATVNIDFRSENIIHLHAPLWGYEDRFDNWALKIMDWFMLNDQPYLYTNKMNTLEKIGHQYHMHEIYSRASVLYQELVGNPPSSGVCKCARDFTRNGILDEMVRIARTLKYFGSNRQGRAKLRRYGSDCTFGYDDLPDLKRYGDFNEFSYGGGNCPPPPSTSRPTLQARIRQQRSADEEEEEDVAQKYLDNSNRETAYKVVESEKRWYPNTLTGPDYEQWIPFSAMLTYSLPDQEALNDFTHYIYCMLNHLN